MLQLIYSATEAEIKERNDRFYEHECRLADIIRDVKRSIHTRVRQSGGTYENYRKYTSGHVFKKRPKYATPRCWELIQLLERLRKNQGKGNKPATLALVHSIPPSSLELLKRNMASYDRNQKRIQADRHRGNKSITRKL